MDFETGRWKGGQVKRQRRNAVKEKSRKDSPWTELELDRLVEEATVDCYINRVPGSAAGLASILFT